MAYIYRDYFILNKLTLSLMTTMIWCCVFNLSWLRYLQWYSNLLLMMTRNVTWQIHGKRGGQQQVRRRADTNLVGQRRL